ncbi:DUF4179 domain-containing protein [Paenibacillus sp. NPDC058071]|uniref:DUF4179 domain-containing protein n=1 Tax=Paenibacillus sp. NPDC058071 TaxID=3346326 RepID=UPI0036D96CE2
MQRMNERLLDDDQLKLMLKLEQADQPIPPLVASRIDETLQMLASAGKRKRRRRLGFAGAAAVLIFVVLAAGSLLSAGMAEALSRAPFIGSVFEAIGDTGIRSTAQRGMVAALNEPSSDQQITMTVTEVFYDGFRLSIGYVIEGANEYRPENGELLINGKTVDDLSGSETIMETDTPNRYVGIINYDVREQLPDKFRVALTFRGMEDWTNLPKEDEVEYKTMNKVTGEWKFSFPVRKLQEGITVKRFDPPAQFQQGYSKIVIHEIMFTPAATHIRMDAYGSAVSNFKLFDDRGMEVEPLGMSRSSQSDNEKVEHWLSFAPLKTIPAYVELKRYSVADSLHRENAVRVGLESGSLPIILSQGAAGSMTITDAEFTEQNVTLRYEIKGNNPYAQAWVLMLTDAEGRHLRVREEAAVDRDAEEGVYAFRKSFFTEMHELPLQLVTMELPAVVISEKSIIRIPIQ